MELLRGGLHADYVPQIEAVDERTWQMAYRLAESNTVTGLTFWGVSKLPSELRPPVGIRTRWLARTAQIGKTNEHLDETAVKLFKAFEEAGVEAVVMKGQAVARYYPKPELRQPGDIDLYADAENYREMNDIVMSFAQQKPDMSRHISLTIAGKRYTNNHGVHLTSVVDGVHVESHYKFFACYDATHQKFFEALLRQAASEPHRKVNVGNDFIKAFPLWFDAVYVLAHLFRHFVQEGVGLRQVSDWIMIACHAASTPQFDRDALARNLDALGLLTMARLLCAFAIHNLGFKPDELPLESLDDPELEHEVVSDIIAGGNWGRKRIHRPKGTVQGSWYFFNYFIERCRHFRQLSPRELAHPVRHKLVDKFVKPFIFRRAEY